MTFRKLLLFLIPLLVGAGLFYWVTKTVGWQAIGNSFLVFTGWHGLVILVLTGLTALLGTWIWQQVLKGMGANVSFRKLWQAYVAGFAIRYLMPMVIIGSEVFQGHILREIDSVTWEKSMASVIVDRVLELTASVVVIFFGLTYFLLKIGLPPVNLALIFGGLLVLLTGLIGFFYFKSFRRESMAKAIGRIFKSDLDTEPLQIEKEIFSFFKIRNMLMWKSLVLSFLRVGMMWFRTWFLVLFLGKSLAALPALSILGFYSLITMVPIPADLGSHEAIQAFAFSSLGMPASAGTAFALVVRAAELLLSLLGIIILFRLGFALLKNTLFGKTPPMTEKLVVGSAGNDSGQRTKF